MKSIVFFILACLPVAAIAQSNLVYLEFSGGNGDALTINVLTPIQLQVESTPSNPGQYWVFDGVADLLGAAGSAVSGTLSYTLNDSPPIPINLLNTGISLNAVSADDLYFYNDVQIDSNVVAGDVLTLGIGAITTTATIGMSPPMSGYYALFLMDELGNEIVSSVIPEPSTYALLLGAGILALAARRRRATGHL